MKQTLCSLAGLGLLLVAGPNVAVAQKPQAAVMPRITVVHPGVKSLRNDLKALFALTDPNEKREWKNVEDFLNQFLDGVNDANPIRIDFLAEKSDLPMRVSIPVDSLSKFRDGIDLLGLISSRVRKDKTLYKVEDSYDGFLRFLNGYASFAKEKNDVAPVIMGNPTAEIADLVNRKFNVGAEIVNTKLDEASRKLRRDKFAASRANLMAAMKKTPSETKAAFDLRRTLVKHQMDEAERLLADIDRLTAGITMKPDASLATFTFDMKPIAGTDLARTVQEFGKTASIFSNVKRAENSILSLRVNHPLDELRKKNFAEAWEKSGPDSAERIDASELSVDEKTNAKELSKQMLSMLKLGSDAGVIDAFVEVTPEAGGKHTMITGLKVPPGCDLVKMLELLPKANVKHKLEKNVAKYGDTDIHKLTSTTKYKAEFNDFFGNDGVVWIGTSESGLWTAIGGAGAEEKLKAAIEDVAKENTGEANAPAIDVIAHLRPWIDLKNKVEARKPATKDKKAASRRQELRDLGRRALDSMTEKDDVIKFRMSRVEDRVEGITEYSPGILRLIGKLMAKFSKDNLGVPN